MSIYINSNILFLFIKIFNKNNYLQIFVSEFLTRIKETIVIQIDTHGGLKQHNLQKKLAYYFRIISNCMKSIIRIDFCLTTNSMYCTRK